MSRFRLQVRTTRIYTRFLSRITFLLSRFQFEEEFAKDHLALFLVRITDTRWPLPPSKAQMSENPDFARNSSDVTRGVSPSDHLAQSLIALALSRTHAVRNFVSPCMLLVGALEELVIGNALRCFLLAVRTTLNLRSVLQLRNVTSANRSIVTL